jgi:hypothetical protein
LVDLGIRLGAAGTEANGHAKAAEVMFLRGDEARAQKHLSRCATLAAEKGLKFERFLELKLRGSFALAHGALDDARTAFEAAIALVESPGVSFYQGYVSDAYLGWAEAVVRRLAHAENHERAGADLATARGASKRG